jgi:hypothetical protein
MTFATRDYIIAIFPAILQCFIGFAIIRRRYYRHIPLFTTYTAFEIVLTAISIVVMAERVQYSTYFYFYYAFEICSITLGFSVIYEIFTSVLKPYEALNHFSKRLLLATAALLVVAGVALTQFGTGTSLDQVSKAIYVFIRTLRLIQAGVLLVLFAIVRSLGLTWRSYIFGIALGYGVYAIADLILTLQRTYYGNPIWSLSSLLRTLAYNLMVVIWTYYFFQPQEVAQHVRVIPHNDLEKWNEKLEELLKPKTAKKNEVEEEENDDQPVSR